MSDASEKDTISQTESSKGYQVVARRYRPKEFQELIGQDHVSQALSNAITTSRIGHAYLFTGARGVGKTSTARIFAKSLNCVDGPTLTPCHACDICVSISTGEDIDVLEIDGASNRGIDEIRSLRQNTSIRPSRARFKIYIIDEVHMLTREAFNALLKTLEEPPGHVKFIFCTTEANKIPITILSRCQRFDFAGIDSTAIGEKLAQIASIEKVTAEGGVFETLARRAAGSMRDAQSLLEQLLSFAPEHIQLSDVHEMLGTADDQRVFRLLESMLNCNSGQIFEELDQLSGEGVDFGLFLEQIMGAFRDLMVISSGVDKGKDRELSRLLLYCSSSRLDSLVELARSFGIQRILAALQILDQTHNRMRFSTQSRILAELAFVRIAHLQELQSLAGLIEQLKKGELQLSGIVANTAVSPPLQPPSTQRPPAPPTIRGVPYIGSPGTVQPIQNPGDLRKPGSLSGRPTIGQTVGPMVTQTGTTPQTEQPVAMDLNSMTQDQATEIWRRAVQRLPAILSGSAMNFHTVRFEQPNLFIVTFPVSRGSTQSVAKTFCERETAKIVEALRQQAGCPLQVRFEIIEVGPAQSSEPPVSPLQTAQMKNRLIAELSDHPIVLRANELFGAEIVDVKE